MVQEERDHHLSDADYIGIFNSANDAIILHDMETYRIIDVNDKASEMFCCPKEEMVDIDVAALSAGESPYGQDEAVSYLRKAASGEPQLFEWLAKDKAGRFFWVEVNLKRAVIAGKYRLIAVVRDINDRKQTEKLLTRINEVFLNFSADSQGNINRLTSLCGELLGADCALYNRLDGQFLNACGRWNVPEGFKESDRAEGHICADVINKNSDEVVVIGGLANTAYAETDPNISMYNLKTYVGRVVRFGNKSIGTLCALYQYDFMPSDDDKRIMGIIASAIGVEEERSSASEISHIAQFSIDRAGESVFWVNKDGRILYANDMATRSLGYSRDELLAKAIGDIDPTLLGASWNEHFKDVKERGSFTFESNAHRKDGSVFAAEITVNYFEFEGEEYVCGFSRNITERKVAGDALLKRDYQLEVLSRTTQHINAILDIPIIMRTLVAAAIELVDATAGAAGLLEDGKIVFTEYNREGRIEHIDYPFEEGRGAPNWIIETRKAYISNDAEHDTRIMHDKVLRFGLYNLVCVPILSGKGELLGCFEIYNKKNGAPFDAQDVFMLQGLAASAAVALVNAKMLVEQRAVESALRKSEGRYRVAAENMPVLLAAIDQSGRFTMWNKYAEKMLGYSAEEAIEKISPAQLHDSKKEADEMLKTAAEQGVYDKEVKLIHKNGNVIYAHLVVVPYKESESNISFYGFAEDVTKRKRAEMERERFHEELLLSNKRLKQLALKDSLTGLYNHHYLGEVIEAEFYRARRYGHPLSVIMLDIDYLKSINDVYGYDFGDLVLKQFAKQLKKMVRRYDVVIRFGGSEFVIISSGMDRTKSVQQAQRILDALNLYNFGDKKHVVKLKVSMSVSSYPQDGASGGMDIITYADKILRKVKEAGGNTVYSYLDMKNGRPASVESAENSTDVKFLKDKIDKLTKRGKQSLTESIFAFAKTIELKDHGTGEHVERTVRYATAIAKALDLPPEDIESVREAAILHDLGKIGISDKILLKKAKLTKKEFDEIKKHPQIAADIIRPIQFMHDIIPLILYHHERWDGKGYPAGLKAEEIPIGARIIAAADVYQALTSNRPYRKAFPKAEAMKMIRSAAGTQFDPKVVDVFMKILKKED